MIVPKPKARQPLGLFALPLNVGSEPVELQEPDELQYPACKLLRSRWPPLAKVTRLAAFTLSRVLQSKRISSVYPHFPHAGSPLKIPMRPCPVTNPNLFDVPATQTHTHAVCIDNGSKHNSAPCVWIAALHRANIIKNIAFQLPLFLPYKPPTIPGFFVRFVGLSKTLSYLELF